MTTAGAGIFDHHGNLIGISTIDWDIGDMIEEVKSGKPTMNSFAVMYIPEEEFVIFDAYANTTTVSSHSLSWDIYVDSIEIDGTRFLSSNRILDNGWLLAGQIPLNEIFAEIEKGNRDF
jgi:hypothetical protein